MPPVTDEELELLHLREALNDAETTIGRLLDHLIGIHRCTCDLSVRPAGERAE